jgi:hypothetical protein
MSSSAIPFPFTPLRPLSVDELRWTVCFYLPKHSDGSRKRLNRLEAQVTLIRAIATSMSAKLYQAKHEYFRCEKAKEKINRSTEKLIEYYNLPDKEGFQRIARMYLQKRSLLNIILYVHANEPEVTKPRWNALKLVEDLIEDDTNEWMEILDYVETMKNPDYLN